MVQSGTSCFTVISPASRVRGWHACRGWHFTSLPPLLNTEAIVTDVNSRETGEGLQLFELCAQSGIVYSHLDTHSQFPLPKTQKGLHSTQYTAELWHSFRMACTQPAACTPQCCKQNWKLSRKTWHLWRNSPEILTVTPNKSLTWIASHDRSLDWQLLFSFFWKTWGIIMF